MGNTGYRKKVKTRPASVRRPIEGHLVYVRAGRRSWPGRGHVDPPNFPIVGRECKLIAFDIRTVRMKGHLAPYGCRPDEFHELKPVDPECHHEVREHPKIIRGHAH